MSAEWDLMKDIAEVSNNGNQDGLAEIINGSSFDGMKRAAAMALDCFVLTDENIKLHSDAAIKLSGLERPESFREGFRHDLLIDKIESLGFKID